MDPYGTTLPRGLAATIGSAARAARILANLTQEDVAERVGLATEVYGRLERGGMLPSVPTLRKLCVVLSIPSDILLGLREPGEENVKQEPPPRLSEEPPEIRRLVRTVKKLETPEFRLLCLLASGLRKLGELRKQKPPARQA